MERTQRKLDRMNNRKILQLNKEKESRDQTLNFLKNTEAWWKSVSAVPTICTLGGILPRCEGKQHGASEVFATHAGL